MKQFPQSFLDKLNSVTNKRPATVIQHILKHGYITTKELKDKSVSGCSNRDSRCLYY